MLNTTKVEYCAFDATSNEKIYSLEFEIRVGKHGIKGEEISTILALDFQNLEGVNIKDEDRLTPFDRAVYSAVVTLLLAGHENDNSYNDCLTPRVIFQLLSGNTGKTKDIGPEIRKEILRSIDKMRCTDITIDASKEIKAFGYDKYQNFCYKGSILPSERIEAVINGNNSVDCIHFLQIPPLYMYAEMKSQIDTVELKMLKTPLKNTPENIELKEYLLRRIITIKNKKSRQSNVIRYDTLYTYLRIHADSPQALSKKKKKINENIITLLDFWKKEGFISSFEYEPGTIRGAAPKVTIFA